MKDYSNELFKVITPATQSSVSFNPPKWLCEPNASKYLEESDASKWSKESVASWRIDVRDGRGLRISLAALGDFDDVVANAEVDFSIECENDEDLSEEWEVPHYVCGDAVRFQASRWMDELIAAPGKLAQILT